VATRGAVLDLRAQLVEAHRESHRRRDLEVGDVRALAADHALGQQRVDTVELTGERLQTGFGGVVGGAHLQRHAGSDHRQRAPHYALRDPHHRSDEEGRHRLLVLTRGPTRHLAHAVLEHRVRPCFGAFDRRAIGFREERRLGHERLERAGDLHRPGHAPAVDRQHRDGRAAVAHQRQDQLVRHVRQVQPRELDALVAQHQLRADDGMRAGDADELGVHQSTSA
jgi:hypothetical protein